MIRLLVEAKTRRKAAIDRRQIVNAILYVARTGCQWRSLPSDFPNWSTVYTCYHRWAWNGTLDKIHSELRQSPQHLHPFRTINSGYYRQPERENDLQRGCDGARKLTGRKRFVVCDTLGLWLEVVILPASVPERKGAEETFSRLAGEEISSALEVVWAEGGFEGK